MSNMRIIEIPASMRESAGRKNTVRKLRVAAYCRVSTEEEEQQGSFEIQKLYYTEKINSTPEWEVAGIYADDGISGVHTKKRDGFNQMIQDCKKRKIDLILTKSISRFARKMCIRDRLEVWFIVGVMYLIVITLLSRFAKRMERRLNRGRQ